MDRNIILAIALSLATLLAFQYFGQKPASVPQQDPANKSIPADQQSALPNAKAIKDEKPVEKNKTAVKMHPSAGAVEKEIVVETDLYKAVLTNRGATFKQVELKKYQTKDGSKPIIFHANAALPPLAIGFDDDFLFAGAFFNASATALTLGGSQQEASLIFEYTDQTGSRKIRRTYTFYQGEYRIDIKDEVQGFPAYYVTLGKEFGMYEKDDNHYGPVVLVDADRKEFDATGLKSAALFKGAVKWIAQEDKYFFSALVPKSAIEEAAVIPKNNSSIAFIKTSAQVNQFMFYVGPKEMETLEKYKVGLEHIVDLGWFSIIARPLFWVLKFFNGFTHNYGYAIILIAIATRVPFIPLINKGQDSMKKLAMIQPRMNEIKEKYKNDPQRMQKEVMELYKQYKVNPVGGCLPMLAQIPVFIALFNILRQSIELRGAPFALWITDLSAKDPYYVLPIVMGATTLIQQKMTPSTTTDPMQQKMMLIMPIVFTFIFLTMPSGVVLYWTVGNLLAIAQQIYMNQKTKSAVALKEK
jgi:YidC/Oxa1 family membrane protein insertase